MPATKRPEAEIVRTQWEFPVVRTVGGVAFPHDYDEDRALVVSRLWNTWLDMAVPAVGAHSSVGLMSLIRALGTLDPIELLHPQQLVNAAEALISIAQRRSVGPVRGVIEAHGRGRHAAGPYGYAMLNVRDGDRMVFELTVTLDPELATVEMVVWTKNTTAEDLYLLDLTTLPE